MNPHIHKHAHHIYHIYMMWFGDPLNRQCMYHRGPANGNGGVLTVKLLQNDQGWLKGGRAGVSSTGTCGEVGMLSWAGILIIFIKEARWIKLGPNHHS